MTNKEREKEISKQPIPTIEECLGFYKELTNLADVRFVPYYQMAIRALEQEPCEDCVNRQAVLNTLFYKSDNNCEVVLNKELQDRIKALPHVTPTHKEWIPVSERLPEVNQRVLVTSYGRVCYAMMTSADGNSGHPIFRLQDSLNERVVCETTVHSEFTTSRIIAWMPLPEPYKTESEGEE